MRTYIRTKTLRAQLILYNFLIICLIATFVSICTYSGGWAVLCLSTDLFKDMLLDTADGQETVIVTAAGDRIASIEEPEEHREENDRMRSAVWAAW